MDWIKDENIINEANKNRLEMSKTKKRYVIRLQIMMKAHFQLH